MKKCVYCGTDREDEDFVATVFGTDRVLLKCAHCRSPRVKQVSRPSTRDQVMIGTSAVGVAEQACAKCFGLFPKDVDHFSSSNSVIGDVCRPCAGFDWGPTAKARAKRSTGVGERTVMSRFGALKKLKP